MERALIISTLFVTLNNMKILALGDTHGRTTWERFVNPELYDKIIFIGDYFDSFDVPGEDQIKNFSKIMEFKMKYDDKVVLLVGNHDFHYLDMNERYSGFQRGFMYEIREMVKNNLQHMQMCYVHEDFLFTHAGVTNTWLSSVGYTGEEPIDIFINDLFTYQPKHFCFTSGSKNDAYGNEICQTPIWVRPESLRKDRVTAIPGSERLWCHVVGHTQRPELVIKEDVILIDVLDYKTQALQIIDGKPSIVTLQ